MRHLTFALLSAFALTGSAFAHGAKKDAIEIIHPHINEPFVGAQTAAGYLAISNEGHHADRLIGVETGAAKSASLHMTEHGSDGVARMKPVPAVEIPAGETVLLEPDGLHVMLMGLTAPLKEGEMVPAVLIFEETGRIEVEFSVDPADGIDHSTMDHGTPSN
ncbi:MAG: hypothetical protein COW54_02200 [Rhodobacteraceae bacterium CG17_big_fil_post_rev_8_21_14_2_50_63_15]|nr:copper chaperone PCu(A)C [Roseovarius sp.]PIV79780.1 MAG: hypothetical protein COW54_02200 [Rhodobacteraceae bacterium CG17_big_fil_post_rev_8_21_14_2_50_63_15]